MSDTIKTIAKEPLNPSNSFSEGIQIEVIGGVASGLILLAIGIYFKNRKSIFKKRFTRDYVYDEFKSIGISSTQEQLRKSLKIIVVDNHDIFPVTGFKEFGYDINQWYKLDYAKLKRLREGEFDLIILDIYDIAKDIATQDGLDILEDIKSNNPAQVVVAYSGHSFDMSMNKFWELADEKLGKPTPFVGTQDTIDALIEKTFSVAYFLDKLEGNIKRQNKDEVLKEVEKNFIAGKREHKIPDWELILDNFQFGQKEKSKLVEILKKFWKYTSLRF